LAWLSYSLLAFAVSLGLVLIFSGNDRIWRRVRFLSVFGLEIGGIILATFVLVTLAQLATAPGSVPRRTAGLAPTLLLYGRNSLLLLLASMLWGSCLGLGAAAWLTWVRRRGSLYAWAGAVLWVVPTFLLALAAQEIQFEVYNLTQVEISGGYAVASPLIIFWASAVLGMRPAVYLFRRARVAIGEVSTQDHVRTAAAKGVPWHQIALSHIVRPALPIIIEAWLVSLRLMIGSLPLVEYFFSYPGIGGLFISQASRLSDPDLVIAEVAVVAGLLLLLEALAGIVQQVLDPRLLELRSGTEPAT
jgi:ABC-type dipeptide/oligopeptide/nickel transport system permease component